MVQWIYFIPLILLAVLVIISAFGGIEKKTSIFLSIGLISFVIFSYRQWGGWDSWTHFQDKQARVQKAEEVIKQFKNPQELIEKLKSKLDQTPASARGWYLLGRLYSSQRDWHAAKDSFAIASRLKPENERYRVNYIDALWKLNQQQFTVEIRKKLRHLLHKNPKQPDALAMLAMDAYQQQHYRAAIRYWQKLLKLTSPDSEASKALRKAIAKAQAKSELSATRLRPE